MTRVSFEIRLKLDDVRYFTALVIVVSNPEFRVAFATQ